jgi:signal transduction histidine kinase/CheY-like chemotaxis protein
MSVIAEESIIEVNDLLTEAYNSRINDLPKSIRLAQQALAISRSRGDIAMMGKSLNQLSLFFMIQGAHTRSVSMAKEAIKHFKQLNDERGIADAQYNIAGVYYKTDNYHLGLIQLIGSLNIYRKFNDHHNQARVLKSLGTIYEYFGDRKNAVRSYEGAIEAARKVKDMNIVSNAYNPLSGIYLKQGNIQKALDMIEQSISIKNKTGDTRGLAFALYGRGKVYLNIGRYAEAEADFLKAIDIHHEMGERLGLGMAYHKISKLYMAIGRLDKARHTLKDALQLSEKYKIAIIKFKCNYLLYEIYRKEGDTVKALQYLEGYLAQREAVINTQTLQVIENYELILKMENIEKEAQMERERAAIVKKQERAEQAAKVKQDFLSTMSHEIRTPLNAVITITHLLNERSESDDKHLLDSLKFASNNLLLLINDILDFNKLDNGRMQVENRPCNLPALLQRIHKTYEPLAIEKGLKSRLQIDPAIAENYELDETKLSQILGNLISNAIKYTDAGTVKFDIQCVRHEQNYDTIKFVVSDTGIGIPKEYYDEMFDSFSQPKSITTRKQGGSGLGLAIVKKLVELHLSEVHFQSTINEGSIFYFEVKLERGAGAIKRTFKNTQQLKNKVALLAEDNMINAMVARKLLSNWGILTEHAVNGLDAIEKSKRRCYDFILMDIHMPEMNGFDATTHIRTSGNPNSETPIFALTADITAESQEQYTSYFTDFLRKPIEIDKLYDALIAIS